jgi:hypothetical protein
MNREPKSPASRVNITKYVKVATEKGQEWRFCPVVRSSNGRIRADYVLVDGRTEFHKKGSYYRVVCGGKTASKIGGQEPAGRVCRGRMQGTHSKYCGTWHSGDLGRQPEADDAVRSMSGVYEPRREAWAQITVPATRTMASSPERTKLKCMRVA